MARVPFVLLFCMIYFQAPKQGKSETTSNYKIPKECEQLGFCEKSDEYPEALAEKLIQELEVSNVVLDSDVNDTISIPLNTDFEPTNPCLFDDKRIAPLTVRYKANGKWYFALNRKINPIQTYNVNLCRKTSAANPKNQCRSIILHNDYESRCIQKNITRSIFVIDPDTEKSFTISFDIPCCCTCVAINKYQ